MKIVYHRGGINNDYRPRQILRPPGFITARNVIPFREVCTCLPPRAGWRSVIHLTFQLQYFSALLGASGWLETGLAPSSSAFAAPQSEIGSRYLSSDLLLPP